MGKKKTQEEFINDIIKIYNIKKTDFALTICQYLIMNLIILIPYQLNDYPLREQRKRNSSYLS